MACPDVALPHSVHRLSDGQQLALLERKRAHRRWPPTVPDRCAPLAYRRAHRMEVTNHVDGSGHRVSDIGSACATRLFLGSKAASGIGRGCAAYVIVMEANTMRAR